MCAFVHENKAYLRLLSNRDSNENSEDTFDPDDLNHNTIINSTVEFTILNQLQGHLNSYFVYNEIDRGRIITLTRDKIDAKVLRNRVIDQLTKDMKERSVFSRDSDSDSSGIIFYSQSSDGSIYQRLDIELPPRSNISRNKYGYLVIDNPVFNPTIMPRYEGFSTHLHRIFLPSEDGYFSPLLVSLKMKIRIKSMAFFTRDSMDMYEWLDSLVERMYDYMSTDRLKRRLDPDLIEMLASKTKEPNHGQNSHDDTKNIENISVVAESSDVDC